MSRTKTYTITVQHRSNVHSGKPPFHMTSKGGQLDVAELIVNNQFLTKYQFECSTCEWNDSFLNQRVHLGSKPVFLPSFGDTHPFLPEI